MSAAAAVAEAGIFLPHVRLVAQVGIATQAAAAAFMSAQLGEADAVAKLGVIPEAAIALDIGTIATAAVAKVIAAEFPPRAFACL